MLGLADDNKEALVGRLAAGFLEGTASDVNSLRYLTGSSTTLRNEKEGATVTQNVALEKGDVLVAQMRRLVRTGAPTDKALWRTFGVGKKTTNSVRSVTDALTSVVDGIVKNQTKALAVGMLPDDLDEARLYLNSLETADTKQERKKVEAKGGTASVKVLVGRVKQNLTHLASIANRSLPPAVAQKFEDALPTESKKKK